MKNIQHILLITLVAGLPLTSGAVSGLIHVNSTSGNDTNSGTSEAPLKTLAAASVKLTPGDVCVIHAGVYRETLAPAGSGVPEKPIIYRAAPGERVVVSAMDLLAPWTSDRDGVFQTPLVAQPREGLVFYDGKRMTEARWPNTTADFIDSPKAQVKDVFATPELKKGRDGIVDSDLPDNLPTNWLDGAQFWNLHWYNGWFSNTEKVKSFDPVKKQISLEKMIPYSDRPVRSGLKFTYVVSGPRSLLDAAEEWSYDAAERKLFLKVPGGKAPLASLAEVAVRERTADLRGRQFIQLEGLDFVGGKFITDEKTTDCLFKNLKILHTEASILAGQRNELRDSEVAFSNGKILMISGERQRVVNCHFHDLGMKGGTYGVWMAGKENLVAYNTFERAGQNLLNLSSCDHCQIVHNFFRDASLIARDSGSIYSLMNGGSTEIAYNEFMTDYRRLKHVNGIYIDGRGSDFIIHHNVLPVVALNPSKTNLLFYHNTVYRYIDYITHTDTEKADDAPRLSLEFKTGGDYAGMQVFNNILAFQYLPIRGLMQEGNLSCIEAQKIFADKSGRAIDKLEEPRTFDFTLRSDAPAVDAGVVLPGVNDGFSGRAPDAGAYEAGLPVWKAGHDFAQPRDATFVRPRFAYANLVQNPGFELDSKLGGWTSTGTRSARFQKGTFSWNNEKMDVWSHYGGARLGSGVNGLEQTISDLEAGGRYLVWGWVKPASTKQSVTFGLRFPNGTEKVQTIAEVTGWVRLLQTVEIPAGVTGATLFVNKTSGDEEPIFFDEASVTKLWPVVPQDDTPPGVTRFPAVKDTYVFAREPDQIFGYRTEALLKQSPGENKDNRIPYFAFDLTSLKGRTIRKASLRLYLSVFYSAGLPALSIDEVADSPWVARGKGGITWNTRPVTGARITSRPSQSADQKVAGSATPGWLTFDITDYVRTRLDGSGIVSIAVSDPEKSGRFAQFSTSQLMMAPPFQTYPPSIEIEF